jgi:putative ABC transport system permease protein
MSLFEAVKIAFEAIVANRLRSILTLLGVIIGVMSVITIISAIDAMTKSFEDQLSSLGPETFIVTKFGIITSDEAWYKALKRKPFTMEDRRALKRGCADCMEVAARAYSRTTVKGGKRSLHRMLIGGGTPDIFGVVDYELEDGRYFTDFENDRRSLVAFVGQTIKEEFFPNSDPIGQELKIKGRKFTIVGLAKKRGAFLGNNQDAFVFIPMNTYIKLFGVPRNNLSLVIKAPSVEKLTDTEDQARAILRARRGVPYNAEDDFSILTADNILSFLSSVTLGARFTLVAISSIALIIGGIVIMNIMMVSVTERTREIGIRKSIGAKQRNIMVQFLFEALILSVGGGIIGTALGIIVAAALGAQISLTVTPSLTAIAAGMFVSTGVGLFFGIYPAMRAARLDPIDALRFE